MSQFKVGDKVVRKAAARDLHMWKYGSEAVTVFRVAGCLIDVGDGNGCFWDEKYFDLLPAEVVVSNEVEKQVPGVPDGYRLVRIGAPKKGEFFITSYNTVVRADENMYEYCWPVVEPVTNETQLPGIPDGYRAVRFGHARLNDKYMDQSALRSWQSSGHSAGFYLIVEKVEPPKPKTRSVVLSRYLVWDADIAGTHRVIVAEEDYVADNWQNFTLLGHSETIEVEV